MRIEWHDWMMTFRTTPIIKVDGKLIRNVTSADDVLGEVKFVKAYKIKTITGHVEIIGERK